MSENETIIFVEKDNGAWIPRKRFPAHIVNGGTSMTGGDLKLTTSKIIFEGRKGADNVTIPLNLITSFGKEIIGQPGSTYADASIAWTRGLLFQKIEEAYICIKLREPINNEGVKTTEKAKLRMQKEFRVKNPERWIVEISKLLDGDLEKERERNFKETGNWETTRERVRREKNQSEEEKIRKMADEAIFKGGLENYQYAIEIYGEDPQYFGGFENTGKLILEVKAKIANEYEISLDYNKAIKAYKDAELPDEVIRVTRLMGDDKVKHLDYDKAIEIYESIGDKEAAKNARKLKAEQGAVKVTQKVVHGDEVTKTEIKDSVLNRSNVGGGSSKMQELEKLAEMKEKGLIDDDDYEKMKREIIG